MSTKGWSVDRSSSLGSGGFAEVFRAVDPSGQTVAAKIMKRVPRGNRDLLALSLPPSPYLVPVLHVEETEIELTIYMPLARESLRDRLNNQAPISSTESLSILRDIAAGLQALEHSVVHRDLKPENILRIGDTWAICDFGISRYVELSTATETQKFSMTAPYAAPEQWRHEHATSATDVYAFGVVAHEVIGGARPFQGPSVDDYRDQHLNHLPPKPQTTKKLASLLDECLFKSPEARPSVQNLVARLERAGVDAQKPGASALADAHHAVVTARAAEQRANEDARTEKERREVLAGAASSLLDQIRAEFVEAIMDGAPAARVSKNVSDDTQINLGAAQVIFSRAVNVPHLDSAFDVVTWASIALTNPGSGSQRRSSRSHALYYANFNEERAYSWYELAFCGNGNADFDNEPKALPPIAGLQALMPVTGMTQLGRAIRPLVLGDLDSFIDEWCQRIGLTAQDQFPRPMQLPEGFPVRPTPWKKSAWRS